MVDQQYENRRLVTCVDPFVHSIEPFFQVEVFGNKELRLGGIEVCKLPHCSPQDASVLVGYVFSWAFFWPIADQVQLSHVPALPWVLQDLRCNVLDKVSIVSWPDDRVLFEKCCMFLQSVFAQLELRFAGQCELES